MKEILQTRQPAFYCTLLFRHIFKYVFSNGHSPAWYIDSNHVVRKMSKNTLKTENNIIMFILLYQKCKRLRVYLHFVNVLNSIILQVNNWKRSTSLTGHFPSLVTILREFYCGEIWCLESALFHPLHRMFVTLICPL